MPSDVRAALEKDPLPLPRGWMWKWQDEVFDFQGGAQPPASTFVSEPRAGYVRLVQIRDYYTDSHITYIPDSPRLRRCSAEDVMIARYGNSMESSSENSLGRICRGIAGAYNVALAKAIPRPGVERDFLYYLLQSSFFQQPLSAQGARSVQAGFNRQSLSTITLPIPPPPVQHSIARILGALDDKIELNRKMNETLEQMARALFKACFTYPFEGLKRLMPGEGELQLVDSPLGKIPRGWSPKTIGDLAEVVGGSTPSTANPAFWADGTHCWATPKDLAALDFPALLDTERRITDAGVKQVSSGLLPVGTVLLSSRAPIGYLAITEVPVAINQGFIAMLPRSGVSNLYLLFWARANQEEIVGRANGTTFLEISKANFRPIPVACPHPEVFAAFDARVRPMYQRIVSNAREFRSLAAIRDALLPKLMSGALTLGEA